MANVNTKSQQRHQIENQWQKSLQVLEVARNHNLVASLDESQLVRNPLLDGLLPSLLFLHFVSIFEKFSHCRVKEKGLQKQDDLKRLINVLSNNNEIGDPQGFQDIRNRRNKVAHDLEFVTWDYVSEIVSKFETQLQTWGYVGNRPNYNFYAERSAIRESDREGYSLCMDYEFGVKLGDSKLWAYAWKTYIE